MFCPLGVEMLSQNDFFTKAILGPTKKVELGVPLSFDKSQVAYAYGIRKLRRSDWLKDTIRAEVVDHLEIPAGFITLEDMAARLTKQALSPWVVGLWLAGLVLAALALLAFVSRYWF